jgi:hypothetical protein
MPETFKFGVAAPADGETAVASVRLYESADGAADWGVVDEVLLSELTPVNDVYTWTSALADATAYHSLVPVSAEDIERAGSAVIPPRPADPAKCTLYVTLLKQTGDPAVGVEITTSLKKTPTAVGGATILDPTSISWRSNAQGLIVMTVAKGPTYYLSSPALGNASMSVATADKDVVNIALLVPAA